MSKNLNIKFNGSSSPTLGVELELFTACKDTLALTHGAPQVLNHFKDNFFFKEELLQCIVEITTDVCNNVDEIYDDLRPKLDMAIEYANSVNMELLSIPIHPFSKVSEQKVSDNDRYLDFLSRMQWPLRRLLITGIHVHVGVGTGEMAIAVVNGLRRYIPFLIALSSNSPFFEGEVTGLASTRTKIFEGLPNTGIPVKLTNYSEFQKLMRTLVSANSIESIREIWWDIRPHPGYGTVEVRVCDSIPDLINIKDLTALIQALVVGLCNHYENGTQLSYLDSWVIHENKWRATRYGMDADLIVNEDGKQQSITDTMKDTILKLEPEVNQLNLGESMDRLLSRISNRDSYYENQLSLYKNDNTFRSILKDNIERLKK